MPLEYKGKKYKELYCKNDSCRKLIGYERVIDGENLFICPRCGVQSLFIIRKGKGQEIIEDIEFNVERG